MPDGDHAVRRGAAQLASEKLVLEPVSPVTEEQTYLTETPTGTIAGTLPALRTLPPFPSCRHRPGLDPSTVTATPSRISGPTRIDCSRSDSPHTASRPSGMTKACNRRQRGGHESEKSEPALRRLRRGCRGVGHPSDGDERFNRLAMAGHSEGSLIGMIAAQRVPVEAFISLEGAGYPAAEVLRMSSPQLAAAPELDAANSRF